MTEILLFISDKVNAELGKKHVHFLSYDVILALFLCCSLNLAAPAQIGDFEHGTICNTEGFGEG